MAYDPTDPADKKIVADLIKAALVEQATEHESDIAGLKSKNTELLAQIKKGGGTAEDILKLENQLEANQTELKQAQKDLRKATKDLTEASSTLETERTTNKNLQVNTSLTEALTTAKVGAPFMDAAKALLRDKVELKVVDGIPQAFVGEKSLGDFTKEWSQGDQGKHFVLAQSNSGNNAPGNRQANTPAGLTMTRSAYDAAIAGNTLNVGEYFSKGGQITEG